MLLSRLRSPAPSWSGRHGEQREGGSHDRRVDDADRDLVDVIFFTVKFFWMVLKKPPQEDGQVAGAAEVDNISEHD